MIWVTLNMPSTVEECCEPSRKCQGISHCMVSGHPVSSAGQSASVVSSCPSKMLQGLCRTKGLVGLNTIPGVLIPVVGSKASKISVMRACLGKLEYQKTFRWLFSSLDPSEGGYGAEEGALFPFLCPFLWAPSTPISVWGRASCLLALNPP